jgi:hypothetical protein
VTARRRSLCGSPTLTALQFSTNYVGHELGPLGDQPFESLAHVGLR